MYRMTLLALMFTACSNAVEEQADEAEASEVDAKKDGAVEPTTGANVQPDPAPLPEPLMRQALMCCADLAMEPVMQSYLELGRALAKGDAARISSHAAAMIAAIGRVEDVGEHSAAALTYLKAISGARLGEARSQYGQMSDLLVGKLETSASGELDLAVAYSREIDHHWLQEGVEPRSPYGDGIQSYSWGTREEVQAADAVREKELANPEL